MQHTTFEAVAARTPATTSPGEDWWVFAEGVKLFAGARFDEAFRAFADQARTRVADYALGVRLDISGARKGVRVIGFWEESAFLRRVTVEQDLGEIESELAQELKSELKPQTPIAARLVGLEFDSAGAPVNLIVDILAAR